MCNEGDTGDPCSIPGSGRSPGEWNGNPLQYSYLGNPMDREAWQASMGSQRVRRNLAADFLSTFITKTLYSESEK